MAMPDGSEIIPWTVAARERPRGILTKEDREYLVGEKDLSDQAERDTRYRIRERVKNAVWDFHLLTTFHEQRDRERVFEAFADRPTFIRDIISYIFLGFLDHNPDRDEALAKFKQLLSDAISQVLEDRDYLIDNVNVEISVEARQPDIDELIQKVEDRSAEIQEIVFLSQHSDDLTQSQERTVTRRMMELAKGGEITMHIARPAEDGEGYVTEEMDSDDAQAMLDQYNG